MDKDYEKERKELQETFDFLVKVEAGTYIALIVAFLAAFIVTNIETDKRLEELRKPARKVPYRSVIYKGDTLHFYNEREWEKFKTEYNQRKR